MCKTIGVDPLKCLYPFPRFSLLFGHSLHLQFFRTDLLASKGFWADVLGVGNFYYELGIQIVEICMKTREMNGGLIEMESLVSLLRRKRGDAAGQISRYVGISTHIHLIRYDVERAVQKLSILGNGFALVKIGARFMVQSIPMELSLDHTTLLILAQVREVQFSENKPLPASRLRDHAHDPATIKLATVSNQIGDVSVIKRRRCVGRSRCRRWSCAILVSRNPERVIREIGEFYIYCI